MEGDQQERETTHAGQAPLGLVAQRPPNPHLPPSQHGLRSQSALMVTPCGEFALLVIRRSHSSTNPLVLRGPKNRLESGCLFLVKLAPGVGALHNLPVEVSRFIGRARELGELRQIVGGTRLLTLTRIGGARKTREGVCWSPRIRSSRIACCPRPSPRCWISVSGQGSRWGRRSPAICAIPGAPHARRL